MNKERPVPAKISRPNLFRVVQRERLFSLVDDNLERPVTWISSRAGSGKTTLISSYLDSRKLPCIWYQCDERDSDPAAFFYYMGLAAKKAAPGHKRPLPLLTPEYLAGIPVFTRRYFERLYSRLVASHAGRISKQGFFIILDNYQDVPDDSQLHELLAVGLDMIPKGIHIVVLSRRDPPAALSRLQANYKFHLLGYSDIRFTLEESISLVQKRFPKLDSRHIKAIHEKAEGWAAGTILMLEKVSIDGTGTETWSDYIYDRVFDYFAGEIFSKADAPVQDLLLKTSFLPVLSVPLAEKLTNAPDAGRILSALSRHHFFTDRISGSRQEYQYHPLFREFLLNRAKVVLSPHELDGIRKDAAALLEQSGHVEGAARLYMEALDWDGLRRMVVNHARALLQQGRNRTVQEWIAAMPGGTAQGDPWLLYWTGLCSYPADMARTRSYLERALKLFKAAQNTAGVYLSWAGIVDTYAFGLDEWKRLDGCIADFRGLRKAYPSFPSREIELIASSRMFIALTLRKTDQPQLVHSWFKRVCALLQKRPAADIKIDTEFALSLYYLWKGEYDKNAVLLEGTEAEIRRHRTSPIADIRLKLMKGIHYWITAQYGAALRTLSEGLDTAERSGVHVFDSLLWSFKAASQMAPGPAADAEKSLTNQMACLMDNANTLDVYFYHVNAAWYALLKGNPSQAAVHLETISAKTESMRTPYYRALWNIGMAQTASLQGRSKDARSHIIAARQISLSMKSHVMAWYSLAINAWLLLREGREKEGLQSLRRALALGRRYGYVHLEFYQPSVMQYLCARALEKGIETDYVKATIKKLGLHPPAPLNDPASDCLDEWPYPVKIYTLGSFEIIRDGEPMRFSGKVQQKPLEMLKAIISFGGKDVPEEQLTDALWPDAEGDLAHKSFETTLGRLRRLLGGENIIKQSARQLTINPLYCWVDSFAFERLFDITREMSASRAARPSAKAVGLHKGLFLAADTGLQWAVSRREMLKNKMLSVIKAAGSHCEQTGKWEEAVKLYTKGIETDILAEEFYQRLMVCYRKLGKKAECIQAYNRCRALLRDNFGIGPSAATEAIYSAVLPKR